MHPASAIYLGPRQYPHSTCFPLLLQLRNQRRLYRICWPHSFGRCFLDAHLLNGCLTWWNINARRAVEKSMRLARTPTPHINPSENHETTQKLRSSHTMVKLRKKFQRQICTKQFSVAPLTSKLNPTCSTGITGQSSRRGT
jgi:hypothetical protein